MTWRKWDSQQNFHILRDAEVRVDFSSGEIEFMARDGIDVRHSQNWETSEIFFSSNSSFPVFPCDAPILTFTEVFKETLLRLTKGGFKWDANEEALPQPARGQQWGAKTRPIHQGTTEAAGAFWPNSPGATI